MIHRCQAIRCQGAPAIDQIDDVVAAVQRCGGLDYTRAQAQRYHDQAMARLQQLPVGAPRSALERITHLSVNRDH